MAAAAIVGVTHHQFPTSNSFQEGNDSVDLNEFKVSDSELSMYAPKQACCFIDCLFCSVHFASIHFATLGSTCPASSRIAAFSVSPLATHACDKPA